MDDIFDESETFVDYSFDLSLCRLVGKQLLPSKMTLKLGIEILAEEDEDIKFALDKMKYWMDNYVSRAVAVSAMNSEGFQMLLDEENKPRLENPLLVTPCEPTDHHLMFVFQSKITALSDGALEVVRIEITSSDAQGLAFTYIGDGEGQLPDMEEWIPGPNWFTQPWWSRDDISMIDTVAPEGADLTARPSWAATLDFLRPEAPEHAAIVINGDWEPKIIEGEKKK
jgi:hypothetical protein